MIIQEGLSGFGMEEGKGSNANYVMIDIGSTFLDAGTVTFKFVKIVVGIGFDGMCRWRLGWKCFGISRRLRGECRIHIRCVGDAKNFHFGVSSQTYARCDDTTDADELETPAVHCK